MRFRFTWVGKTRNAECRALVGDYVKRIARMAEVEVVELKSPALDRGQGGELRFLEKECQSVLKTLSPDDWVILLDVGGKPLSTEALAKLLEREGNKGNRVINVVAGGAKGVDEALKLRAQLRLSLSALTFPHDVARALAAEQVYRCLTLLRGLPYHY